jgi:hypothetical protein
MVLAALDRMTEDFGFTNRHLPKSSQGQRCSHDRFAEPRSGQENTWHG